MSAVFGYPSELFLSHTLQTLVRSILGQEHLPQPRLELNRPLEKSPSCPIAQAGEEAHVLFMCSQHEWPGSLAAPRKRVPGKYALESDTLGHQGACLS